MTILVTGCAGFIGTNFVKYYLKKYPDRKIIGLDKLTYAGNLENLKEELEGAEKLPTPGSELSEGHPDQEQGTENRQPSSTNYQLVTDNFIFIRGDICDINLVNAIFDCYEIDGVMNFAAESHVDRSIHDPQVFLKSNVLGTQVLLDAAKKHWQLPDGTWKSILSKGGGNDKEALDESATSNELPATRKFLQVSTDEVYGSLGPTGLFTEDTPLDPHSPYSASKASADLIVKAYHDTYNMPINITRCSNNYGPFQFPEKLIPLMIHNALDHKSLPVYGDGKQVRDWIYVEDHCRAIDMVLEKGKLGEVFNIGGYNERENIYIVRKILDILRERTGDSQISEALIRHVKDRLGHDRRYAIDNGKIAGELGWNPTHDFDQGLRNTIDWYLSNQKWIESIMTGDYSDFYKRNYGVI